MKKGMGEWQCVASVGTGKSATVRGREGLSEEMAGDEVSRGVQGCLVRGHPCSEESYGSAEEPSVG